MNILLSGAMPAAWGLDSEWSITRAPLNDAGILTDYDLVVLKPSLFGGIFDVSFQSRFTEQGQGIRIWDSEPWVGPYLQSEINRLRQQLLWVGSSGGLIVLPVDENRILHRSPKNLNDTIVSLNRAMGTSNANFTPYSALSNLDLLDAWKISVASTVHGTTSEVTRHGHPFAPYLRLKPIFWKVAFETEMDRRTVLSMDRTAHYWVALEIHEPSSLVILPEINHAQGLRLIVQGVSESRNRNGQYKIRGPLERRLLSNLEQLYKEIDSINEKLDETAKEYLRATQDTHRRSYIS